MVFLLRNTMKQSKRAFEGLFICKEAFKGIAMTEMSKLASILIKLEGMS